MSDEFITLDFTEPRQTGTGLAQAGLIEALDRLDDRVENGDADPRISLGEVLAWLYSLEDWHKDRLNVSTYFTGRDASVEGRTLGGLIYARRFLAHGLVEVAELIDAGEAPLLFDNEPFATEILQEWAWKDVTKLNGRGESGRRDVMYRDHVAGRLLREPLPDAVEFITKMVWDLYPPRRA